MKRFLFLAMAILCAATVRAQCYTSGTTFTESWNKSGGDPCYAGGPSACQQTWIVNAGTGQTVTAAPGTGFNCANVLKLPFAATGLDVEAYGTIPYIPQSTGPATYDLNFEYYYDSTNVTAFRNFLVVQFVGAGTPALTMQQNSNASGQVFLNTGGALALSVSTRHLIHIHVQGASSFAQIDGGGTTAFTAPAADAMMIKLLGDTTGANLYFGNIYISAASQPGGAWPPNAFMDFTGGTNNTTVTAALLNGGTHCGNGGASYGNWSYAAGASTDTVVFDTGNTQNFPKPLTVCTASFNGNSGVSVHHNVPAAAAPAAIATYTFATTYTAVSFGMYWKVNTTLASVNFTDQGRVASSVGNGGTFWHICGSADGATCTGGCAGACTTLLFCPERRDGVTIGCNQITNNTWYWLTFNFTSGTDTIDLFDVTGNHLLATYALANGGNPATGGNVLLQLGGVGSEIPGIQQDSYYSNVIVDTATAQFPLLPPGAGAGGGFPMVVQSDSHSERLGD